MSHDSGTMFYGVQPDLSVEEKKVKAEEYLKKFEESQETCLAGLPE